MSAAAAVALAIIAALEADAPLGAWTAATPDDLRVYRGLAPAPGGRYVTVFVGPEVPRDVFDADGFDGEVHVRAWAPGDDTIEPAIGYGHIRRILHRTRLVLDDFTAIDCSVALRTTQADPDRRATQALGVVTVRTVALTPAAA